MSKSEIDDYLRTVGEPKRSTLEALRRSIHEILPDAEECISYGMPGFRYRGKVLAGFAAFKNHLSYFPHSGSVLAQLSGEVVEEMQAQGIIVATKATLRFPIDTPLPHDLVERLLEIRIEQLFGNGAEPQLY